jgi:hypothetical protein
MKHLTKVIAAVAVFALSGVASASTTFDFRTSQGSGVRNGDNSLTFTSGALDVTIRGYELEGFDVLLPFQTAVDRSQYVDTNSNGIIFDRPGDGHVVDGFGDNEFILFTFSQAVSFNSINFDFGSGSFQFFRDIGPNVGGGITGTDVLGGSTPIPGGFQIFNFNPPSSGTSTTLGIAAIGNNDAFKIRNINVTAAIPEPATWLMMILGFAIVGLARKRRVSKQFA